MELSPLSIFLPLVIHPLPGDTPTSGATPISDDVNYTDDVNYAGHLTIYTTCTYGVGVPKGRYKVLFQIKLLN